MSDERPAHAAAEPTPDPTPDPAAGGARAGAADAPTGEGGGAQYTAAEQAAIRAAMRDGARATCPRDGATLTHRPIGGGSFGLGYARRREWLLCPTCRRSALFDVRRGTRN